MLFSSYVTSSSWSFLQHTQDLATHCLSSAKEMKYNLLYQGGGASMVWKSISVSYPFQCSSWLYSLKVTWSIHLEVLSVPVPMLTNGVTLLRVQSWIVQCASWNSSNKQNQTKAKEARKNESEKKEWLSFHNSTIYLMAWKKVASNMVWMWYYQPRAK